MHTTNDLLDLVKSRHNLASDYKLGIVLQLSKNGVSQYRKGVTRPDDFVAIRIAKMLEMDPAYIVTCMHAERAKTDDVKTLWLSMAKHFEHGAAAVLAVILSVVLLTPGESQASASVCSAGEYPLTCSVPQFIHCGKLMAFFVVVAFCLHVCQKSTLFPFFARRPA